MSYVPELHKGIDEGMDDENKSLQILAPTNVEMKLTAL